jgi:hypothetical protein
MRNIFLKFTNAAIGKIRLSSRGVFVPLKLFLICVSLLFASCAGSQTTTLTSNSNSMGAQNANMTPPPSQSVPQLTASPNPVPFGPDFGTTKISWDTGDGTWGQVYVSTNGEPETLFMQGAKGSAEATWIGAGGTYEFRLYAGPEHKKMLASINVSRAKKLNQNPN